jgi:hypothetical protein
MSSVPSPLGREKTTSRIRVAQPAQGLARPQHLILAAEVFLTSSVMGNRTVRSGNMSRLATSRKWVWVTDMVGYDQTTRTDLPRRTRPTPRRKAPNMGTIILSMEGRDTAAMHQTLMYLAARLIATVRHTLRLSNPVTDRPEDSTAVVDMRDIQRTACRTLTTLVIQMTKKKP